MTEPTDTGTTPDPDAAEEFADEIAVDPTQEEIDTYRRMEGDDANQPPAAVDPASAG